MSFLFRGPSGSIEYRWISYALLRDNVLHYLEGGAPSGGFPLIHRISEALSGNPLTLDARALRAEAERARDGLLGRPISDLAMSGRTRALLSYSVPDAGKPLESRLASECGFPPETLVPRAKTFDDAFGFLVQGLIEITASAQEGENVEVMDI